MVYIENSTNLQSFSFSPTEEQKHNAKIFANLLINTKGLIDWIENAEDTQFFRKFIQWAGIGVIEFNLPESFVRNTIERYIKMQLNMRQHSKDK